MNKHYIRTNDKNIITTAFSDAFIEPLKTDIFIEDGGRHYNLTLYNDKGYYKYKYINGEIVETTDNNFNIEIETKAMLARIEEIKQELQCLDYKSIKRIQGHYTDEEWQTHVDYCNALRDEMNGLQ